MNLKLKFVSITLLFLIVFGTQALADVSYAGYQNGYEYVPEEPLMHQSASVTVMDVSTGLVLYGHDQHSLRYPASITKVMTALLVLENVPDVFESVLFSARAVNLPWYASNMSMTAGDILTVYEALYGIMLPSGNDVANALAEHVSGNLPDFVNLMNQRAIELGAVNTVFVNACGLPGHGQHTTSYDVALIMKEAISHPLFVQIIQTPYFDISPTYEHPEGRTIRNTNRLIHEGEFFNEWVVGGKTGFTRAAGHTLVTYSRKDNRSLIVSVLYAPRLATFTDTSALLEYSFALPLERWESPYDLETSHGLDDPYNLETFHDLRYALYLY